MPRSIRDTAQALARPRDPADCRLAYVIATGLRQVQAVDVARAPFQQHKRRWVARAHQHQIQYQSPDPPIAIGKWDRLEYYMHARAQPEAPQDTPSRRQQSRRSSRP